MPEIIITEDPNNKKTLKFLIIRWYDSTQLQVNAVIYGDTRNRKENSSNRRREKLLIVSATSTQKSFFYSKNQNHVACI
jgi:hypothetical protein